MIERIGVLGELSLTDVTSGNYSIYTVPIDKAAKGKLVLIAQAGVSGVANTLDLFYNNRYLCSKIVNNNLYLFTIGQTQIIFGPMSANYPVGDADDFIVAPTGMTLILGKTDVLSIRVAKGVFKSIKAQFIGAEFAAVTPHGAKGGVLGSVIVTNGPGTVYAVPKGFTAIGHVFIPSISITGTFDVVINGVIVATMTGSPTGVSTTSLTNAILTSAAPGSGTTPQSTIAPSGVQFRLTEGDVVSYNLTGTVNDFDPIDGVLYKGLMAFVGTEYPLP